jgi:glycosyltransferase involved in cell wall biosynthesis
MKRLVSIVMSTFNESEFELQNSIDSILNQTYDTIEFIIVHDNPSDIKTRELLLKNESKDKRIKLIINNRNIGLAESLNKGISFAKGDIIARMDADDISMPNRIETQISHLDEHMLDVVSSNCIYIDENNQIIGGKSDIPTKPNSLRRILPYGSSIIHPSVMFKKQVFMDVGGYRNFDVAQDYDLWLRILTGNYKIGSINEPLLHYRLREKSISYQKKYKQFLTSKYQVKLYKQRKVSGKDEFSHSSLETFLSENNYYNEKNKSKFLNSFRTLDNAFLMLRKKDYVKGFFTCIKAFVGHKHLREILKNLAVYRIVKYIYS